MQNSCTPGAPGPSDTTCNGIDENCNGSADEGYVSTATSCGVGACASTGVTSCVSGAVQDSCVAGTPAASDTTCNGIDENCNGQTDEGYAPVATACGVGACASFALPRAIVGDNYTGAPAAQLYSLLMLVFSISPILAPSVGSLVVQFGDWRKIFWVMAFSGVLSLVLAVFGLKETRPVEARVESSMNAALRGYWQLLRDGRFLVLDATLPVDDLAGRIRSRVSDLLG